MRKSLSERSNEIWPQKLTQNFENAKFWTYLTLKSYKKSKDPLNMVSGI